MDETEVKYKQLLALGKLDELRKWRAGLSDSPQPTQKVSKVKAKKKSFQELRSIKGIGSETISDLNRIYSSESDLIKALSENKVPLRNDVVKKLRKHYRVVLGGYLHGDS